jgi:hypothetical protein
MPAVCFVIGGPMFFSEFYKRLVLAVFCICAANAFEKTESEYLNGANVFLDVQKNDGGLTFVGKESGSEKFRYQLLNSEFGSFTSCSGENFQLQKLNDALSWQYQSGEEFFEMLIRRNGDAELLSSPQTYTGFDRYKTYGIKTLGALENRGHQAFWFLVTSANAFHNYGTIQTYSAKLYNNYLFNSGVIKLGEMPTERIDLTTDQLVNKQAKPNFKHHTVENYGTFTTVNGKFQIKDGLSYHEYNVGDFEDLEMFGGDLNVQSAMKVTGALTGNVRDITIEQGALLLVNKNEIKQIRNLNIHQNGKFHTVGPWDAKITGSYFHAGQLSSGDSLNLNIACGLSTNQTGMLLAPNEVSAEVARIDAHKPQLDAPSVLGDPAIMQYLKDQAPKVSNNTKEAEADLNTQEFEVLKTAYHKKKGYEGGKQPIHFPAEASISKKHKQIIYTDFYLNIITYHYLNGLLQKITETGYIWQRREKKEIDLPAIYPPEVQELVDVLNALTKTPLVIKPDAKQQEKAKKDREYHTKLMKELRNAGASIGDIDTIYNDPIMNALRNLREMNESEQEKMFAQNPELVDLSEAADDARDYIGDRLEQHQNSSVKRFITDVVIPIVIVGGILIGDYMAPQSAPETAPVLAANWARLVPVIGRAAVALGAAEIYEGITSFFKQSFGGDKSGKDSGSSGRIQNNPQDAWNYMRGLRNLNVLGNGHRSGKYMTHEVTKDCTYKGYQFKKGNIISRDTRHHEIEVFQDPKTHLGAIEPKYGSMYKGPDPMKKLYGY